MGESVGVLKSEIEQTENIKGIAFTLTFASHFILNLIKFALFATSTF